MPVVKETHQEPPAGALFALKDRCNRGSGVVVGDFCIASAACQSGKPNEIMASLEDGSLVVVARPTRGKVVPYPFIVQFDQSGP